MSDVEPKRKQRTNTNFSVRLSHEELGMIDEMAERSGISRNALIRLSVRQLAGMEFLDARELTQAAERMDAITCQLGSYLKKIESLMNRIPEDRGAEHATLLEMLQEMQGQMERIQDSMIEAERKVGRMLLDFERHIMVLLGRPTNRKS